MDEIKYIRQMVMVWQLHMLVILLCIPLIIPFLLIISYMFLVHPKIFYPLINLY